MTGSGTEQDPYVVQTIAEIFEAAAIPGVYVRVEGNNEGIIDVARDASTTDNVGTPWRMGTNRVLEVACERLYSDDNSRVDIRGLISTAPQFIRCTREPGPGEDPLLVSCAIENLGFTDCVFLRPGDAPEEADIELTSDGGVSIFLRNTSFSLQMRNPDPQAARRTFVHGGIIYDSAFYAGGTPLAEESEQSRVAGGSLFLPDIAERVNIEAHGWYFTAGDRALIENTSRSLILADVSIQNGGVFLRGCASNMYAITPTRADPEYGPELRAENCTGVNVLDKTIWGNTIPLTAPDFYRETTEECKDAAELRRIGFLP